MLTASPSPLRFALGGMAALAVAMGIGRFVYTPILPGMMEQLGLSATQTGLIASANFVGYLAGAIAAAGAWAQGRERLLALGWLAASAVLCGLMAATDSFALFLALRFLGGVASAFVLVFVSSIVFGQLSAAGRNDLQAMHFGGVGLGIASSAAMMAVLISLDAGWRAGWIGAAILSLVGFIVAARLLDRGPVATDNAAAEPPLPRDRPLVLLIIAYGLFGFGYIITATFLIAIVRAGGSGPSFESMVWLATGLAVLPSVFLWNAIARRVGVVVALAAGCMVEAIGVAASVSLGGWVGPLLGGILLGATFIGVTALGLQAGRQLAPQSPRLVLALMTATFGIGQILGPIAAGFVAEWTGDFVAASFGASLVLMLAAGVALLSRLAPKSP